MRGVFIWMFLLHVHAEDTKTVVRQVFIGESIHFRCTHTETECEWKSTSVEEPPNLNRFTIDQVTSKHDGDYQCRCSRSREQLSATKWSNVLRVHVHDKPVPVLTVSPSWLSPGASLTLSCDVDHSLTIYSWKFYWYTQYRTSDGSQSFETLPISIYGTDSATININGSTQTAGYVCRAGRGNPIVYTHYSDPEFVWSADDHHSVSLKVSPGRVQHFVSESVVLTCEGNVTNSRVMLFTDRGYLYNCSTWGAVDGPVCNLRDTQSVNAVFWCESELGFSNAVNITRQNVEIILVSSVHPVTVGQPVTIGCKLSTGQAFLNVSFYKDDKLVQSEGSAEMTISAMSKSDEGFYKCQHFGKESPQSWISVKYKAVVTLQPNWPQLYIGESLMVRCEISGENSEWEYEWKTSSRIKQPNSREFRIHQVSLDYKGDYQCKGRMKRDQLSVTEWSDVLTIRIIDEPPVPDLTVSPSWLSPGASLTLSCDVDHPSAGWKFYWYKKIRTISDISNRLNILPIRINGTDSATITINEPTQTTEYVCRAGRGDPIVYTHYSSTKFVWSADDHHSVSLKVSPGRVQHFVSESVVLTCEGNVTNSRVMLFTDRGYLYNCSTWGAVDGPVCNLTDTQSVNAVFWCESELGFSNAVNITRQNVEIILVSSVHPVTVGQPVTIGCKLSTGQAFLNVSFYKDDKLVQSEGSAEMTISAMSKSDEGFYKCQHFGKESPQSWISVKYKAMVTLQPNWPQLYIGESLMVRCEISGENSEWEYEWKTSSRIKQPNSREFRIHQVSLDYKGDYQCKGRMKRDQLSVTEWSDVLTIRIIDEPPVPDLTVSPSWLSPGASLTLSCDVDHPSAGWKFYWYKKIRTISDISNRLNILPIRINGTDSATITINEPTQTTEYVCRAGRGDPIVYTHYSSTKFVWSADDHHSVSLKVSPGRVQHFVSESVVLTCEGNVTNSRVMLFTDRGYLYNCSTWGAVDGPVCNLTDTQSVNAVFWCESELGFSNAVNITRQNVEIILVSSVHPVTVGQPVTIGCKLSTGQAFLNVSFYKDDKLVQSEGSAEMTISAMSKSDEGFYKCQHFGKESPQSWISVKYKAVVTLQPNWPQLYIGESLMVRCEISGENSEWEYEWKTSSRIKQPNSREFRIHQVSLDYKGDYQCKGRMRRDQLSVTEWSDVLTIRIIDEPPVPDLTVSPSWLSPGASLTLSCDVDHPSAGWKFYWYKKIRTISDISNRFNILPISINGTDSATITINEPTQKTEYVCRAGRGDPIVYTHYSSTKFVWSADDHHSVSLKVSPGQVQHFVSESVLLTCEGNVINSRVMLFTNEGDLYNCSTWGAVDGSVCKLTDTQSVNAVFWCESELGFSNAVNITRQNIDIILVSPVHPVTEGQSVTISCKLSTGQAHSNVSFYKDDKLVQSEGRAEMTISAVSESDEGFYKCQHFGKESPQSWMSVKTGFTAERFSPHPLFFFVVLLTILLVVVYFSQKIKRSNNQNSVAEIAVSMMNLLNNTGDY